MPSSHEIVPFEPSSEAEAAFLAFQKAREAGEEPDLDEICRRHPELADDLRALNRTWSWLEDARGGPAPAPSEGGQGRYSLRGELGRGGMGIVFKVWDRELRRHLALKVCRVSSSDREAPTPVRRSHLRFLEEAQVTAQLDHPGVVPIHELGVDRDGHAYFAMRMVEGRTLGEVLELARREADGWSRTRVLGALVQVCETLAFAHSKGVVHRDLKPSNIMVGRFGEVYVMDWGLAKVTGSEPPGELAPRQGEDAWLEGVQSVRTDELESSPDSSLRTVEGSVLGTPSYMSPEQADGRHDDLGPTTDVYAVGAILYHALAGTAPYAETGDIVGAVRTGPPRRLDTAVVPAELASICERAMARRPGDRYPSMGELAEDLRASLENRVVRAHATGALAEARKWVARNRALSAALLAVVAIVVAAVATGAWMQRERIKALDAANAETRAEFYAASIAAAGQALRLPDTLAARQLLDACPEDLRGWEWQYLYSRLDESDATLGQAVGGQGVVWSPDGKRIVGVYRDETQVFDVATGEQRASFREENDMRAARFSLDGRRLIVGTTGGLVVRDAESFEVVEAVPLDAEVYEIAVDPTGERIAHSVGTRVQVRDASTLERAIELPCGGWVFSLAWRPDGRRLAVTSNDHVLQVFDVETGDEVFARELNTGPNIHRWAVAWSPDGAMLATGVVPGVLLGLDPETGETVERLRHTSSRFYDIEFLPSGLLVVADRDDTVSVVDLAGGEVVRRLHGHSTRIAVAAVAVSPTDGRVASIGNSIKLWSPEVPERLLLRGHTMDAQTLDISPDGSRLLSGARDRTVRVWDLERGESLFAETGLAHSSGMTAFGPRGERVYTVGLGWGLNGAAALWIHDARTGALIDKLSADGTEQSGVAVGPNGRWALTMPYHEGDGFIWDLEAGEAVRRLDVVEVHSPVPAFSPDGRFAAWGDGGSLCVLESPFDGEVIERPTDGGRIWGLCFDPASALLATAGYDDGSVRLWSTDTFECTAVLQGHAHRVFSADFSPDGSRLATGSADGTVGLWDLATHRLVYSIPQSGWVVNARFAPDGTWIVSSTGNELRINPLTPSADMRRSWQAAADERDRLATLVDELFERLVLRRDVVAALERDEDLSDDERQAAIRMARSRAENALTLANEISAVIWSDDPTHEEMELAFRKAEVALSLSPDDPYMHQRLGLAHYHLGDYEEALIELERAAELNTVYFHPYDPGRDLAWKAMTLHRLGRFEEARAALEEAEALESADRHVMTSIERARRVLSN